MSALRSISLAISLLLAAVVAVHAQAPASAPSGMTQQQFDSLVDAISKSVAEKLKADGVATPPKPAKPAATESPDAFGAFFAHASEAARAIPTLGRQFATIPRLLDESERGGRGPIEFLLLLGLVAVAAVLAEEALRRGLGRLRAALAAGALPEQGLRSIAHLVLLALLDGIGVFAVWLVCHAAVGLWFSGDTAQDKLAGAVLTGIFGWRLYVLLFRILLRPGLPSARLCDVQDGDARAMYGRISVLMLLVILFRILFRVLFVIDTPPQALAAYQSITVLVFFAAFAWLVVRSRDAARQWFGGLGRVAAVAGLIGRHWIIVGLAFFAALSGAQFYAAVSGRVHVAAAMLLTLNLVVGVLVFETLLQAFVRRLDSQLVGRTPASDSPKLPDVIARCRARGRADRYRGRDRRELGRRGPRPGERKRMGPAHPFLAYRRHHAVPGIRGVGALQIQDRTLHGPQAGRRDGPARRRRRPGEERLAAFDADAAAAHRHGDHHRHRRGPRGPR